MKTYADEPETQSHDRLLVGVSEYVIAERGETLVAYGLGACVAIALYDPENDVGGLAHTMLPKKSEGADGADGKFVDSAVHSMLREMIEAGAGYDTVEASVVGGADIFELEKLTRDVGERNARAAREELESLGVTLAAEAVGEDFGRTVEFDTESGEVVVVTADDEPYALT